MPIPLPPLLVLLPPASMIVLSVLAPISDSGLLITTCSRYVPTATCTVSLALAADMPALIVRKHPARGLALTQMVAADAGPPASAKNKVQNALSKTTDQP